MLRNEILRALHTRKSGPGLRRWEVRNRVTIPDPVTPGAAKRPVKVSVRNSLEALVKAGLVERDLEHSGARASYVYWRVA